MRRCWHPFFLLALCLAPACTPLPGDPPVGDTPALPRFADIVVEDEHATSGPEVVPAEFETMRFEEEWRFLGDPEVTTDHWFPEMKHQELSDGWTASYGGQLRYRYMDEYNKDLMKTRPRNNRYHLSRLRAHADLRHSSGFRVFVEGLDARIGGNDRPAGANDRNDADVQNAFVEYGADGMLGRVGRLEFQQGAGRILCAGDWINTRFQFQGGLFRSEGEGHKTDVFFTKPVKVDARDWDSTDGSREFSGIYHTFQTHGGATTDVFGLLLEDDDETFVGGSGVGDQQVVTLGGRYEDSNGDTDYEAWGAYQFGDYGADDISAYAWSLVLGHTFPDAPGSPRVALDVDYASGDDDPTDSDYGTFNQLFPLGHTYLGRIDLVGRQNIFAVSPSVTVTLNERTSAWAAYHVFKLAEREDALYSTGSAKSFDDPTGTASRDVGQEIDFTVTYKPEFLDPHGRVLVGYSKFFADDRIDDLGGRGDADFFYVEFTMTF